MTLTNKSEAGNLLPMTVTEGVTVKVLPNTQHEYLMTTKEVATGYGVTKYSVFKTLDRHVDELIEGKHFVKGVYVLSTPTIQPNSILWIKKGIVRLGFFIRSERAKLFRDWAEELIIKLDEQLNLFNEPVKTKHLPEKRNHNRITQERLVDLLADVCRIDDKELRLSITNKLMGRA